MRIPSGKKHERESNGLLEGKRNQCKTSIDPTKQLLEQRKKRTFRKGLNLGRIF